MLKNFAGKTVEKKGGKFKKVLAETWARISLIKLRAIENDVPRRMRVLIKCRGAHLSN